MNNDVVLQRRFMIVIGDGTGETLALCCDARQSKRYRHIDTPSILEISLMDDNAGVISQIFAPSNLFILLDIQQQQQQR